MKTLKHAFLLFFFLFITIFSVSAQLSQKDEQLVNKADAFAEKKEYSKAIELLRQVLKKHENNSYLWNRMANYSYKEYLSMKDIKFSMEVKKTGDGGDTAVSNLVSQLMQSLNPGTMYFNKFVDVCKEAQLVCEYPEYASFYLRNYYVDKEVDTNVSEKAYSFFNKAETEFGKKNFEKARKYYQRAIEIQPDFYKARLYLGDTYYAIKDYGNATIYFKEAVKTHPDMLEPRKYLTDAYLKADQYEKAIETSIDAILVYPDAGMFWKLEDAAAMLNKKFDRHWIPRRASVNVLKDTSVLRKTKKEEPEADGPWKYYKEALAKVAPYCNENGIIAADNPVTKHKYLEVYSWEYMLNKSDDPSLEFARKMKNENLLDCYVFFSMYHFDIYGQSSQFVKSEPEKVKKYMNSLIASK